MTKQWLGLPWQQVRYELDKGKMPYTLHSTCAPNRDPFGDDVRVVQVVDRGTEIYVTVCAFMTRVIV